MARKIITIIAGVVVAAGGIYCFAQPMGAYLGLVWLIGIFMVVEGISESVAWNNYRKQGVSEPFTLVSSFVSVILGALLLFSFVAQYSFGVFLTYIIALWVVAIGVLRIVTAVRLRKIGQELDRIQPNDAGQAVMKAEVVSSFRGGWALTMVIGVAAVALGIVFFAAPVVLMDFIGYLLGACFVCTGISVIALGLSMPSAE